MMHILLQVAIGYGVYHSNREQSGTDVLFFRVAKGL